MNKKIIEKQVNYQSAFVEEINLVSLFFLFEKKTELLETYKK
jgi:hypothetical protein